VAVAAMMQVQTCASRLTVNGRCDSVIFTSFYLARTIKFRLAIQIWQGFERAFIVGSTSAVLCEQV